MGGEQITIVEPGSLQGILVSIGDIFGGFLDMAEVVGATIVANPLLLVGVSIPLAGAAIGFFRRLLQTR